MEKISILPAIMAATLGDYARQDFSMTEESDELIIRHDGVEFVRMGSGTATVTEIRRQCQNHLILNHGIEY